ncbi:ABC-2 type transport system ATP-binding protein [Austwickia chelonae]|uniref:Putative ABC transporter ATP-binding protein n=1 Tax=Austwickia chelonae NBRC 105200 TaxID=1184607 RepID=K6VT59_9MICO|nr:ATP-binding cassette domain-containing protein [Austwickia chelonae]GAB78490.1 putative ABC transporter ATP-binding protein [Austwickia chelonae NBRC 105200]SEW40096.1 ABC-2 type transport system ATP-binding protein [Austwickia chelonae]
MSISFDNVSLSYSGFSLNNITFNVSPGEIVGFLGPNGSGKSTTLRVLLGLETPQSGDALIEGKAYRDMNQPLRTVGSLLDTTWMNGAQRAEDYLRWLALSNDLDRSRIPTLLERVGLASASRRKVSKLSLGMRQRLGIAAALLGDPPYLVFDEPLNGLDPEGIRWVRTLLGDLRDEGRGILLSSHILAEVSSVADRVAMIAHGSIVGVGTLAEFEGEGGLLAVVEDQERAITLLADRGVNARAHGDDGVLITDDMGAREVTRILLDADIPFSSISQHEGDLERAFFDRLTQK